MNTQFILFCSSQSQARILTYQNWPEPSLLILTYLFCCFLAICKQCNDVLSKQALLNQMREFAAAPPTPEPVTEAPLEAESRELEGVCSVLLRGPS